MFGFEARAFLKRLAKLHPEEWEKHYPRKGALFNLQCQFFQDACKVASRRMGKTLSNSKGFH